MVVHKMAAKGPPCLAAKAASNAAPAPAPVEVPVDHQSPPAPPPTPTRSEPGDPIPVEATEASETSAVPKDPVVETYHDFFKQQRAMNFKNYLALKKSEKLTLRRQNAAVLIQKVFRGWRIRENMKLVHHAATIIQAGWRGAKARELYRILDEARQARQLSDFLDKMATRIQAAWRGYWSRKNSFNFKIWKDLQEKNKRAEEQARAAAELEKLVSRSSTDGSSDDGLKKTNSAMLESLANMLDGDLVELASKMTPTRVSQLYTIAKSAHVEGDEGPSAQRRRTQLEKIAARLSKAGPGYDAGADESLAELMKSLDTRCGSARGDASLEQKRSSFYMFPKLPNRDDYFRPDPAKVQLLREAIRLLRDALQQEEVNKLGKHHYLMRTVVIPGVYSDIFTNELTEIEQQLKSLKFYEEKATPPPVAARGKTVKRFVPGGGKASSTKRESQAQARARSKMASNLVAQIQFQSKIAKSGQGGRGRVNGRCNPMSVSRWSPSSPAPSESDTSYQYCSTADSLNRCPSSMGGTPVSPYSTSKLLISPCPGSPGVSPSNSNSAGVWKPWSKC